MKQDILQQKVVGVVFGGRSPEHDVSIITGMLVIEILQSMGVAVEPIYITTDGAWCLGEQLLDKAFLKQIHTADLYPLQGWFIDTRHRRPQLTLTKRPHFFTPRVQRSIDIVFPAMHGPFGEDGTLQGLCEIMGVPYVGCDVAGSAISMDKALTKQFLRAHTITTTPSVDFSAHEWSSTQKEIIQKRIGEELLFPVFVKPVHGGSSIGITKVKSLKDIPEAVETACTFDVHCIVESGVSPVQDITCCVRERADGTLQASLLQDSGFGKEDFFTYQEKYLQDGGAQLGAEHAVQKLTIPAILPADTATKIRDMSLRVFSSLQLSGIARIDHLYNPNNNMFYVNEINPMPGTLYHHLWKSSGVSTEELMTDLLLVALQNHKHNLKKTTYFSSSILNSANSTKTAGTKS